MYSNYNNTTVFNLHTSVNWFEDNSGFWFIDYSKERKSYKTVAFKSKKVKDLFDHERLTNELNSNPRQGIESKQTRAFQF